MERLNNFVNLVDERLCKNPFGKDVNRIEVDTLPNHFTLSSWSVDKKDEILNKLSNFCFEKFVLKLIK